MESSTEICGFFSEGVGGFFIAKSDQFFITQKYVFMFIFNLD